LVAINKRHWPAFIFTTVALIVIIWVIVIQMLGAGPVMSSGVSDSGRYAITAHKDNSLILWDLQNKKWQIMHTNANVYSAQFIPDAHAFLWQDLNDKVTAETIEGRNLLTFQHFPTYGHAISSDLKTYLSADKDWNIFAGFGESREPVLQDGVSPSFTGSGKLLNLAMARQQNLFLTSGFGHDSAPIAEYPPVDKERRFSRYSGVTLWDAKTGKPIAKFQGNSAKTHATISPDGQWVVSGDENGIGLYWNTNEPSKRHRLARYYGGIFQDDLPEGLPDQDYYNQSELIQAPKGVSNKTITQTFIHKSKYYLRFGNNSHIAALFRTGSPWPVKYFDLGESPELVTYGSQYSRNTAIATSPEAGVLVMGHRSGGGISVYQFDHEELTLERAWVEQ